MGAEIKPKWDIADAIIKGEEAYSLATKYQTNLLTRLKTDELSQLKLQVEELGKRRPAQKENLNTQKSKTAGQDDIAEELHDSVISIRVLARSNKASDEILQAYGVGEKINKGVSNVIAAANAVIKAYNSFKDWSNTEAGILEEDITALTATIAALQTAAGGQNTSVSSRKYATTDKNVLQRGVEDEVTRLSAMGAHVMRKTNPAVAKLFEDLIPANPKEEKPDADQPK
ncbi:MAG TPA: hypothetical protein VHO90_17445 [Bacteroidales bacterium]|nr:hypothetical protein [Bacteroidales bacterium]